MTDSKSAFDWDPLSDLPPLPSREDKLFATAEDWWNNACLNYARDGWNLYALGYKEAADTLVSHVDGRGRGQDMLVYPIVFLYRQYLELALKEIIREARNLEDINEPFPKTHRIDELWRISRDLLQQISPAEPANYMDEIGRLIDEFSKVDPTSMAFRYPEDREGNPSLPGITNINLRNVRDVIAKIALILDGASTQIDVYLGYKAEMYQEFQSAWY